MKPSGLADSPFFRSPQSIVAQPVATQQPAPPIYERPPQPMNERTNARSQERPAERPYHRYTYDLFDDQVDAIDDLTYRWRKTHGKHVTKGYVIRQLLDQALSTTT